METQINFQNYKDGKLARLSPSIFSKKRILYYIYAAKLLGFAIILLVMISRNTSLLFADLLIGICVAGLIIGSIRCINKATEVEEIFFNNYQLDIIYSALLKKTKKSYAICNITSFKFGEAVDYGSHPLKGESFDYLGFQTEQQVVNNLNADGNLNFLYKGRVVRFGKGLGSWHFDEINREISLITGMDLTIQQSVLDLI